MAHVMAGEWVEDTQDMAQELTPIAEIRAFYAEGYEECGAEEIEGFVGSQMWSEGYELSACENEAQRVGWQAEFDTPDDYAPDFFDAEQLADMEQRARDVADREDRQHNYSYFQH